MWQVNLNLSEFMLLCVVEGFAMSKVETALAVNLNPYPSTLFFDPNL